MEEILNLPLEKQACHCDQIAAMYCDNERFLERQFKNMKPQYKSWNRTSIGNMARIAVSSPEPYAAIARQELENFTTWFHQVGFHQNK